MLSGQTLIKHWYYNKYPGVIFKMSFNEEYFSKIIQLGWYNINQIKKGINL